MSRSAWISNATRQLPLDEPSDAGQMREGGGAGEAQSHQPAAAGGDSAHTADGVVDAGQDPRGLGLQKFACGGEGYLSCGAVEERDVQFCFQLPDRMRHRRLRHVSCSAARPKWQVLATTAK